jgi:hypothetical protein
MALRAVVPDALADLRLTQLADEDGSQQEAEQECGENGARRTEGDVPEDIEDDVGLVQREEEMV